MQMILDNCCPKNEKQSFFGFSIAYCLGMVERGFEKGF